ncbi:MAG: hypothetical protein COB78_10725 [Hyphomicrobiales bacterium]|nr:MAG: hypothetical protein COB78_10725 [Hyphomicrobiales bacterium]
MGQPLEKCQNDASKLANMFAAQLVYMCCDPETCDENVEWCNELKKLARCASEFSLKSKH